MYRLITDRDLIARYVARETKTVGNVGAIAAVGLVRGDEVMAGAVFYSYLWPNILMNIAADRMTPAFVAAICDYAFRQVRCKSITGLIHRKNKASRKFSEHLGAKMRGVLHDAAPNDDIFIYQLMAKDAEKWASPRYMQKLSEAIQ